MWGGSVNFAAQLGSGTKRAFKPGVKNKILSCNEQKLSAMNHYSFVAFCRSFCKDFITLNH